MTVMQWLYRAKDAEKELAILQRMLQQERDRACKMTANYSQEGGGGGSKDPTAKFDAVAEFALTVEHYEQELRGEKTEIIEAIRMLPDGRCRRFCLLRFVECKSWKEIGAEMHYSQSQLKNIWKKARTDLTPIVMRMDKTVQP